MNQQPISKRHMGDGLSLLVHSVFQTIQGEGPYCGMPAVFLRLAGCNLQCPDCDTEYTEGATTRGVFELADAVMAQTQDANFKAELVVITGGEPFRQNLSKLILELCSRGVQVQIESNGTLPPSSDGDVMWLYTDNPHRFPKHCVVVCSPKTGRVNPSTAHIACCYKYVLTAGDVDLTDGLPLHALGHPASPKLARPPVGTPIYLQPADHKDEALNAANLRQCVDSCMRHGYRLQLQVHKIIDVE
ncbi:putative queuosine biosynthesis protein [Pseudomonas phage MiCath]|uniref:Queuosine biosynthesis protein n=1 Tax=Pseudomonas phage MiCath TaxID=3003729 RepID=A0AAF0AEZ8_9CAUD|nr:putative queuosine biosynthesis protein [Pseudomonas phage MiCath]WAX22406.1 putative queuosine biosynthesis protein [Pseudomonas phage MiCath]